MKSPKALALLKRIRRLDTRITSSKGRTRRRLINRRADLIIRYIAALALGVILTLWRGTGGGGK